MKPMRVRERGRKSDGGERKRRKRGGGREME